ncbi:hypothetical protein SPH9361_04078 [Sphingobium sp. CECT 9361]|nr:hypothetical protein SPH9361_04078 [Sphingobium sp. CECT 9361]
MRAIDADAEMVAGWVRALAGIDASTEKVRAAATIARYLVHVGWAYRMAGLDDPTAAPLVRIELKAARKTLGTRQRQARALRFGVAQDNFVAGESLPAIMQAYRWRDPKTVMRYGAKLAAKSGASARMAARLSASATGES